MDARASGRRGAQRGGARLRRRHDAGGGTRSLPAARDRRGTHPERATRHQRRDRLPAQPDGDRPGRLGPAGALERPLPSRSRHAGEGARRAPLRLAVDRRTGPPAARVRAVHPGDLPELPERERRALPGQPLRSSRCCRPSSAPGRSSTRACRSRSPRSIPTWVASPANSATGCGYTRSRRSASRPRRCCPRWRRARHRRDAARRRST